MDPGMQFQKGIATMPAEGIWRHLVLKPSTWVCCLLDMNAPPQYSWCPEEALPWYPKAKVLHLCPVNFQAIQVLWGKRKAHYYLTSDTRWPLTQKLQLFSFITCVAGRRLPLLSISLPCRLIFKAIPECSSSLGHFFSRYTRMKWQALRKMGKWSNILNISFTVSYQ